ncbi:MAG: hypothetical protein ACFCU1_05480 [Sumerlaeia bacterium]
MLRIVHKKPLHALSTLFVAALFLGMVLPANNFAQNDENSARNDRRENQERERTDVQRPAESAESNTPATTTEEKPASTENTPSTSGGTNTQSGGNNQPPADASTREQTGNTPPPPEPPRRKEEPKQSAPTSFTLKANNANLLLRIHAEGDYTNTEFQVVAGEQFTTDISLTNQESKAFNKVRLVLDYNPSFVQPQVINDSNLLNYLDSEPIIQVNRKLGQIIYSAELSEPITISETLVFIQWEAVKPVLVTSLRFGRHVTFGYTEIFLDDLPMLGEAQQEGDGVVSSTVRIIPSDPAEALMMQEEPQLYMGSDERVGGVELRLIPPKTPPRVGEEFYVYVVLDNSVYSNFDKVSLMIEFNPEVITVLDDDYDNWITHGVNIQDGEFRDQFPFNYHIANMVFNVRGMIEYRAGTSLPEELVGVVGTLARIRAVATKPTSSTEMKFFFAPREGLKTTEVKYMGQDSLGDTTIVNDGTRGARFAILPELQTSASTN